MVNGSSTMQACLSFCLPIIIFGWTMPLKFPLQNKKRLLLKIELMLVPADAWSVGMDDAQAKGSSYGSINAGPLFAQNVEAKWRAAGYIRHHCGLIIHLRKEVKKITKNSIRIEVGIYPPPAKNIRFVGQNSYNTPFLKDQINLRYHSLKTEKCARKNVVLKKKKHMHCKKLM